jgi:hypothetical protein
LTWKEPAILEAKALSSLARGRLVSPFWVTITSYTISFMVLLAFFFLEAGD